MAIIAPPAPTPQLQHQVNLAITANGALANLPANAVITQIHIRETAGHAVTGGINIGKTAAANDIVAAKAVGANALVVINPADLLLQWFSTTSTQTLFISAASAWNSASVEVTVWYYANNAGAYGIVSIGGTVTGALAVTGALSVTGNLDVAGSGGITIDGANGINVGPNAIFIGPNAGSTANVATAAWDVYIGSKAGQSHTTGSGENNYIGSWAGRFAQTTIHSVAVGQTALMAETVGNSNTAIGADTMRQVAGTSNATAIGSDSMKFGSSTACVAVGAQALSGNSSNITVGGTATAGDILNATFTHAAIPGSPLTVSYTVLAGQTPTQMAVALAAAITADPTLFAMIGGAFGSAVGGYTNPTGNSTVIGLTWSGTNALGPTPITVGVSVTGAGTETLTLAGGPSGNFSNIAIGYKALFGTGLTTGNNNICIGVTVGQSITTASANILMGSASGLALTTGNSNIALGTSTLQIATTAAQNVVIGAAAGALMTTSGFNVLLGVGAGTAHTGAAGSNVLVGSYSGGGITSGFANTFIGTSGGNAATASATQCTTGANNISIGNQVAIASPTTNNQLCIGNFIYGTGLSGTGTTISTAKIGLGVKAPAVELEVVGTIRASVAYQVGTNQVVGARSTGWTAMTGTPDKVTAYDTSTITLAQLAGRVMAMQAADTTHGLLGA